MLVTWKEKTSAEREDGAGHCSILWRTGTWSKLRAKRTALKRWYNRVTFAFALLRRQLRGTVWRLNRWTDGHKREGLYA